MCLFCLKGRVSLFHGRGFAVLSCLKKGYKGADWRAHCKFCAGVELFDYGPLSSDWAVYCEGISVPEP